MTEPILQFFSYFHLPVDLQIGTLLIVILILLLVGALPRWPYSAGWGVYPAGGLGLILLVVIILLLFGRI